jgi:hypothetical protein
MREKSLAGGWMRQLQALLIGRAVSLQIVARTCTHPFSASNRGFGRGLAGLSSTSGSSEKPCIAFANHAVFAALGAAPIADPPPPPPGPPSAYKLPACSSGCSGTERVSHTPQIMGC